MKRLGIDSFASVPIFAKDKVIGVIDVDNYLDRHPITEEDLQIIIHAGPSGRAGH